MEIKRKFTPEARKNMDDCSRNIDTSLPCLEVNGGPESRLLVFTLSPIPADAKSHVTS